LARATGWAYMRLVRWRKFPSRAFSLHRKKRKWP
jgi:hypothetical protein